MLNGKPPFSHHENQWAAMYHITNSDPALEIPKECSPKARDFLNRCLRLAPKERWPARQLLGPACSSGRTQEVYKQPRSCNLLMVEGRLCRSCTIPHQNQIVFAQECTFPTEGIEPETIVVSQGEGLQCRLADICPSIM